MPHATPPTEPPRRRRSAPSQGLAELLSAADTRPGPAKRKDARLLIRGSEGVADDHRVLLGFLGRLLDWAAARSRSTPIVGLRVADLQGRQYFSASALLPVIDLPLPAGTYHVTVSQGDQHRRYTVALEQGITFDLQLRGATAHPWAAPEEPREPGRDDAQIS